MIIRINDNNKTCSIILYELSRTESERITSAKLDTTKSNDGAIIIINTNHGRNKYSINELINSL